MYAENFIIVSKDITTLQHVQQFLTSMVTKSPNCYHPVSLLCLCWLPMRYQAI